MAAKTNHTQNYTNTNFIKEFVNVMDLSKAFRIF